MDAFIAGAWRTPSRGEVSIGGAWRRLTRAEVYIGGQWRSVLTFVPPMTVSVNPSTRQATVNPPFPQTRSVTAGPFTATPAGGQGPYTYAWSVLSGPATLSAPSQASTNVSATLTAEEERVVSLQVIVTDAGGSTATATATATLSNTSFA